MKNLKFLFFQSYLPDIHFYCHSFKTGFGFKTENVFILQDKKNMKILLCFLAMSSGFSSTTASPFSTLATLMAATTLYPSTTRIPPTDCPTYNKHDDAIMEMFSFWIEGVLQCCVAIGGLFGNLISGVILSK